MALSVDKIVDLAPAKDDSLPPESRLEMPVQDLRHWPPGGALPAGRSHPSIHVCRWFVFSATLALTGLGTYEIYQVISPADITWLQVIFAGLFAVTFAWISFACASAVLGFLCLRRQRYVLADKDKIGRTALLMPVYHEDPETVAEALGRMGRALAAEDAGKSFDIFVLSDSREAAHIRNEVQVFAKLREQLSDVIAVYYRRRADNHHKKAGNIADFVTRWGGTYEAMIVLDADSMMAGSTLVTLARALAADPKAGIIQSLPLLHNRWTLYARMQQFAGRVYGPIVANGLAAWHGRDGNYWGHNAIIRVKAFAEAAGLPELEGRKPFGGHVMSHDFVEAALMRRAGWAVYMLPGLGGSYEETPPNLIELAARDRRWSQGNLQHMKLLTVKGLHWVSRIHFLQGIMSYLASPLWLFLLMTGLVLSTVAKYTEPNYFPEGFSLFPAWPVFDPERALRLFTLTMAVLFVPKILGILAALLNPELRRGCGGAIGLFKSLLAESFLSALLSPIMMLIQSGFVLDVLLGRDSGWKAQKRTEEAPPFNELLYKHAWHIVTGVLVGVLAFLITTQTFLWLSPIVLGLALSAYVSWVTGLVSVGKRAWAWNIFRIPEEAQPVFGDQDTSPEGRLAAAE
ncbi:glucans biosynthesis glucosyltransferase MdoH [Taklimakanibacter lacteus]|uniref:glucans biosynthesis glucosyltransferase MdoH n=1 Tax=Taklimakanibacter lacteus TaxID=2268456 RepID=UPI000E675E3D